MFTSKILSAALLLALFSSTQAQSKECTKDIAVPLESLMGEGSNSPPGGAGSASEGVDFNLEDIINGAIDDLANEILEDALDKRQLERRALSCTSTESCFSIGVVPFCINPVSGDYHNEIEKGNIITGDYVRNDGGKGNLYSTSLSSTPTSTLLSKSSPTSTTLPSGVTSARITSTTTRSFTTTTTPRAQISSSASDANTAVSTWWSYTSSSVRATPTARASQSGPPAAPSAIPVSGAASNMRLSFGAIVLAFGFGIFLF